MYGFVWGFHFFFYSRHLRAGIVSRKATYLFLPCCFVSGAKTSSFCEFLIYLFLIAILMSNCVGSLCPSSVFFRHDYTFLKRCLTGWRLFLWKISGWQGAKEDFRLSKMCLHNKDSFFVEFVPLYATVSKNPWVGGFIRGGSAPRSNPLPFYIPFFAKKVPLSYTLYWQKVPLSHTLFRTLVPLYLL